MIIPINNKSKNFYAHMGAIFGSREVERATGDRFYDDEGKIWYLYYHKGSPITFVSVQDGVIKNVWTESRECLVSVLQEIKRKNDIKESVVPLIFKNEYEKAGFHCQQGNYKNFIVIRSDKQ